MSVNVRITGRHLEVTDALRSYIENALTKVTSHFDKVTDANVILSVEKHHQIAEINLSANGVRINGREDTSDMYASVDAVIDKVERQVRKFKDRINRHQPRTAREARVYEHAMYAPAPAAVGNGETAAAVAHAGHHEVQREKLQMRSLSVDEAVMQLELVDDPFLVFLNAETSQVNVLYAAKDGHYGLIEPQF